LENKSVEDKKLRIEAVLFFPHLSNDWLREVLISFKTLFLENTLVA
jgi:hypothetical protein